MIKKLNILPEQELILLGILSVEKDYKLCHEINRWLDLELSKMDNHEIFTGKSKIPSSFTKFFFSDEAEGIEYFLFLNRGNADFLVPEHRNIDYIMMLRGNVLSFEIDTFTTDLKTLPSIQGVYVIESDKLKSKDNFIFN